jgi:TonB family protein
LLCVPLVYGATGTSPDELANGLEGKIVFLRGMEGSDKLRFDIQGVEIGSTTSVPFAYSALKIEKVHRAHSKLEIEGERGWLVFQTTSESPALKDIRFVPMKQAVDLKVALNEAHPEALDTALHKIFASSPGEALAGMSPDEEKSALDSLGFLAPLGEQMPLYKQAPDSKEVIYKPNTVGVAPPRVIHAVDPGFTEYAKEKRISGVCVLGLIVDTSGRPQHIRVVRSVDPGLDVNAIIAAGQYRFEPSIYQGKPVAVWINLEINFRIY